MAELKFGSVTITIPEGLALPEEAGKLSPDEVRRLAKARKGLGLACEQTARAIEATEGSFLVVGDITPQGLREAGHKADALDSVLADLENAVTLLKQANLIFENEGHKQLGKVNDQYKAQGKHDKTLAAHFEGLEEYFAR
jgi:hypothetical protein